MAAAGDAARSRAWANGASVGKVLALSLGLMLALALALESMRVHVPVVVSNGGGGLQVLVQMVLMVAGVAVG